jgi:hypothetical protein
MRYDRKNADEEEKFHYDRMPARKAEGIRQLRGSHSPPLSASVRADENPIVA